MQNSFYFYLCLFTSQCCLASIPRGYPSLYILVKHTFLKIQPLAILDFNFFSVVQNFKNSKQFLFLFVFIHFPVFSCEFIYRVLHLSILPHGPRALFTLIFLASDSLVITLKSLLCFVKWLWVCK